MAYQPFQTIGEQRKANILVICDHAANTIPDAVAGGDLGLSQADMNRHIAYDVGAAGVSRHLGAALDAPVCLSNFSRLVIDPNRGDDDPTLLMQLYDGSMIPANRAADGAEVDRRLALCHRPYHAELARLIAGRDRPVILSIHSFTAQLRGRAPRPWQVGVLSNQDRRLSDPILGRLAAQTDLCVGDNEPYTGALVGDTMDRHALGPGLLHTLIELRNDLIGDEAGQKAWSDRLAPVLADAISEVTERETA